MRLLAACLLFSVWGQSVLAGDLPESFSSRIELSTQGSYRWYRATLPGDVYWLAAFPDLRDMRVFNSAGEALPYALQTQGGHYSEMQKEVGTKLFPLYSEPVQSVEQTQTDMPDIHIRRDRSGTIVDITSVVPPPQRRQGKTLRGWLLDAGKVDFAVSHLALDWEGGVDGFQAFSIEGSDDLMHWRWLADGQIFRLGSGTQRVERSEVQMESHAQYLRLIWQQPETAPVLKSVRILGNSKNYKAAPLAWTNPITMSRAGENEFLLELPTPLSPLRARVELSEPDTLAPVALYSVEDPVAPPPSPPPRKRKRDIFLRHWQHKPDNTPQYSAPPPQTRFLASGVLYRLPAAQGEKLENELALNQQSVKRLKLSLDSRGTGLGKEAPALSLALPSSEVIFLARGSPPFYLVLGNRQAGSAALSLSTLIPDLQRQGQFIGEASVKTVPAPVLAPSLAPAPKTMPTVLKPAPVPDTDDSKKLILWSILLVCVALLLGMAFILLRATKKDGQETQ